MLETERLALCIALVDSVHGVCRDKTDLTTGPAEVNRVRMKARTLAKPIGHSGMD
jgi:hypothetical protein